MMKEKLITADASYTAKVEALLQSMANFPETLLNRQPANGGWSAMQIMHHLILSEAMSKQYIDKKMSFETRFPPTGLKEKWRYFTLWLFLVLPIKWPAPDFIGGNPEVLPKYTTLAEITAKWRALRKQWADFLQDMPEDLAGRTVYKHPRAGKIGWLHMIGFFNDHFERHRKQIHRTLRN